MFCLRLCFLRLEALLFSSPFSFRDGIPDIGNGACRFFFRCPPRDFRLRCSYPLYCFADAAPGNGAIPAVVTDLVTIARTMLCQPRFESERCLLYVAYAASWPAPCLLRTSQAHSAAVACPFPHGGRKFHFVLARIADTTQLCLFARRTNTIECGLRACMFCLECIFLFPGRACHALPRHLRLNVPTNAFFAYSRRICAFPSTSRECRSRLWFITFFAFSFVSVFRSQRAPIHFFTTPEPQQQFPPYFCAFLKRCCRERSVHKQTMPVLDPR